MHEVRFGWLSPVIGNRGSDHQPIVLYQQHHILPVALRYFDSLWIADHFYGFDARTDPFMEAWTTLTWLAARFDRVLLCHHVLGHGYRPPALTAKMAATLQVLSGGRFILGIGAGWREDEYRAYGYDFPPPSVRFAQLDEVIEICRRMWTEDLPSFSGKYFTVTEASASPRPDPVPRICVGASGERFGLPLAGRRADMWNGSLGGGSAAWVAKRDIVRASAEAAGRDPDSIEVTVTIERPLPESDSASGAILEDLGHLHDLGATHFIMDFGHPSSTEPVLRFAEQVMAPLRAR